MPVVEHFWKKPWNLVYLPLTPRRLVSCSTQVTETIVRLVHRHLGLASVVNIEVVKDGISLTTANGTILVDQELTERIDT